MHWKILEASTTAIDPWWALKATRSAVDGVAGSRFPAEIWYFYWPQIQGIEHWVDVTHHCLLSPDSSQVPCQQAITPNSTLALAQMELLGKADLRVKQTHRGSDLEGSIVAKVEQTNRRSDVEKQNPTANIMSWRVNWSELILSAYLCRGYIWGATVLVFLPLCVKDLSTRNMWTAMNIFFQRTRNCQKSCCCGDLRSFWPFFRCFSGADLFSSMASS